MATELMLQTVEQFKEELKLAQNTFNADGRDLERRANRTTMHLNELNVAFDMVHEGARITAEFYASCDVIVLSLDSICRPLLEQKPEIYAVKAVVDLIKKVNDAVAQTSTSFTVSLNGSKSSDVGSLQPIATMEALRIQKFWESYYRRMPEYIAEQKIVAEKKEKEKAEAQSLESKIREQEKHNEELLQKADALTRKYIKKVEQFEKELEEKIQEHSRQLQKAIEKEQKDLEKALKDRQKELNELGVFQFTEKKRLKLQIQQLKLQLNNTHAPQYGAEEITLQKEAAEKAVSEYRCEIEQFCDAFISTETKTVAVPRIRTQASARPCTREEKTLLAAMSEDVWYYPTDLAMIMRFSSKAEIVPILNSLVHSEHLEKTIRSGRSAYALLGNTKTISYEIVTLNEKQTEQPCPEPPSLECVLGKCIE